MSNNTTLNAMSGGDTIQTFDNTTYKTQAVALVTYAVSVNSAGQLSLISADTTASGSLTSTSSVTLVSGGGLSSCSVQVTGTWAGTLVFEASVDGVNFSAVNAMTASSTALTTSTSANGVWTVGIAGMAQVRVRCSVYTSGTAVVTLRGSTGAIGNTYTSSISTGGGTSYILQPCACATTANITLSGEQTIDGIATSSSRVLVKNQTTNTNNGIYTSGSGAWTRTSDFNTGAATLTPGVIVPVLQGTANKSTQWTCTTNAASITIGTSAIIFGALSAVTVNGGVNLYSGTASGTSGMTIGGVASGTSSTSIGLSSTASGNYSVALGVTSNATAAQTIAIGSWNGTSGGANASANDAIAIGYSSSASKQDTTAIGYSSTAGGTNGYSTAIGSSSSASGDYSVALGNTSSASAAYGSSVGYSASCSAGSAGAAIGALAYQDNRNEVAFGGQTFASTAGNAQDNKTSIWIARGITTNATPLELGVNVNTLITTTINSYYNLSNNATYIFDCRVVARNTASAGNAAAWTMTFAVNRDASAATTTVSTPVVNTLYILGTTTGWSISAAADTTNGRAAITATGAASTTIRWAATCISTKVTN